MHGRNTTGIHIAPNNDTNVNNFSVHIMYVVIVAMFALCGVVVLLSCRCILEIERQKQAMSFDDTVSLLRESSNTLPRKQKSVSFV